MKRRYFNALCGVAAAFTWFNVQAQAYPERPIKIYQGFASGGNADAIARAVGAEMGKAFGQSVIVEAQTGAGGTIAASTVARAKPDGYTLLMATGGHSVGGALYKSLPYKTVDSFQMISTVTFFPFLIVVNANSKLLTFKDLMEAARAKPEAVSYGTAGIGTTHHLAGELLAKMAQVQMLHVPYRGDAGSVAALLAGDIPFIIAPPTAVMSNLQAGKLRALATTGSQRWSTLPQLPTIAEQGVTGYDVRSWAGLMAPAGTPAAVIERLNAETLRALQVPAVRQRLADMGGDARGSSPEEMRSMVHSEVEKWNQVVTDAGILRQ